MSTLAEARARGAFGRAKAGQRAKVLMRALESGPKSTKDLVRVLGWNESWVCSCVARLRCDGQVVLLVEGRPERISNGSGIKNIKRKLYALPSDAPFVPYSKRIQAERARDLGPSVPELKQRSPRPRSKSGSGVIAPPPFYRGMVWGAGW